MSELVLLLPLLFLAGCFAGFINVVAGGGSLLTLPLMIFFGVPDATANGTNRVAILMQNVSAVMSFRRKGFFEPTRSFVFGAFALPGAVLGSLVGVDFEGEVFHRTLAVVLVVSTVLFHLPKKRMRLEKALPKWCGYAGMFLIGVYGGLFQAGVGFFLMMLLYGFLGEDLKRTNMHKVVIVLVYTLPALGLYFYYGKVLLLHGLVLGCGNALGGWCGAYFSVKSQERTLKWVVTVILALFSMKLWLE